jgi:pyruvate kinase
MANELRAQAIISMIRGGSMTRYLSWLRPKYSLIYALGPRQDVAEQLTMNWAVTPVVMPFDPFDLDGNIELALKILLEKKMLRPGHTVVVVSSIQATNQIVDAVQMRTV